MREIITQALDEIQLAVDGLAHYANELYDLCGDVIDHIDAAENLLAKANLPEDVQSKLESLFEQARDGADMYAETLEDTGTCAVPLGEAAEVLESLL